MKYLIMVYMNPHMFDVWESMSDEERTAGAGAHLAVKNALIESGELIASGALMDAGAGVGVRVVEGKTFTTDGPFAEAKEHLAGFYFVECENIDRAIEYAARMPEAEFGVAEVRPIRDLSAYGL